MMPGPRALPRYVVALATLLALSACTSEDRDQPLGNVDTIEVPVADTTTRVNFNIDDPTLEIPTTYPVADGDLLTLVWSDEFNGGQLDPETWFFESGDGANFIGDGGIVGLPSGWGNNELQWYLPDNAQLEDGVLKITARRETVDDFGYTSARITTRDRFAFKYGRIEASIKLPSGQGLWPAFWLLSQNSPYGSWAATGEIDILEAINLDGQPGAGGLGGGNDIFGTIHFGGEFPANQSSTIAYTPSEDVTAGFNTYALEWDEFEIRWYFNGILYGVQNAWSSTAAPYPAPFDQPFHILLNLAVGGNLPGPPNGSTPFPATMEVDWVRVYSGEADEAAPADPGIAPDVAIYAADGSAADLDPVYDPFGSGSSFATVVDSSFANALQVTVGAGYGGGALAQLGLTQLAPGFASGFGEFVFKVKGLTADNTLLVKFEAGGGAEVQVDLTAPPANVTVTDLGDGWSQVAMQMSVFGDVSTSSQIVFQTLDGAYAAGAVFYLTDIGFTAGGGAGVGVVPEVVIYAADGTAPDLGPIYDPFGSGSAFATVVDSSFANALEVTVGVGYGGGALAQLGLTQLAPGFASGFGEFVFKVKGLTADNTLLVKFEAGGGAEVQVDLTAPPANVTVTDLGDGWSQVVMQMSVFGDVSTSSQIVFQTLDGAYAAGDVFYLTDIGFMAGSAGAGVVPEVVIYAADGAAADLAPVYDPFGSGSAFATVVDSSYANALEVTVGVGYGGGALAQLGLTQLAAGFAATYDEFVFKVKGLTADNTLLVKFEAGGGAEVQVDLTAPPANVTVTDLGDGWSQVVMQMSVFGDVSTSSQIVFQTLDGAYAAGAVFYLTDIGFMTASGGGGPGLVVNGGFDDGFTGWETFNNGGTFTIAATAGSDGGPAANLNATSPANPTIKQTLIGAGVIGPNQTFSVTFDWRGTAANGGVIAFQVFSEQTGGGVTKADLVQGGDGFPADWTTVGPLNFTSAGTAAAVGDGLTLEISAICGGVAGCVSDLFIDNLVVEIVGN